MNVAPHFGPVLWTNPSKVFNAYRDTFSEAARKSKAARKANAAREAVPTTPDIHPRGPPAVPQTPTTPGIQSPVYRRTAEFAYPGSPRGIQSPVYRPTADFAYPGSPRGPFVAQPFSNVLLTPGTPGLFCHSPPLVPNDIGMFDTPLTPAPARSSSWLLLHAQVKITANDEHSGKIAVIREVNEGNVFKLQAGDEVRTLDPSAHICYFCFVQILRYTRQHFDLTAPIKKDRVRILRGEHAGELAQLIGIGVCSFHNKIFSQPNHNMS